VALYRGTGGAVFDIAPPEPGTNQREYFDAAVAAGDLVPVDAPKPKAKAKPAPSTAPAPAED
jgi:hypothetical protein